MNALVMNGRILILYASKCGSTAEVAQVIAETLRHLGAAVDVCPVKQGIVLDPYNAVVIGSAVRYGQWLPEAEEFITRNRERLRRMPVAFFCLCITLYADTLENRYVAAGFVKPLQAILRPVDVGLFAGKIDYGKLTDFERAMLHAIMVPQGDYRKWDAIRTWAHNLEPKFR